ncbi:hypothetical protein PAXRUDRAFT_796001 [Paxillus rubicundulus Ve08.2h10]|uniref:Uncharacterized protein n=1 Tax=Paxillus rubicundulus Ve08.2h10 TaxID=930991 RepID=A0A0D0D7X3_9AGAM|nr:hypothetical protein PAXRUDRAFT_796001 [Paxillus rubicundulus Ve08.2h10]
MWIVTPRHTYYRWNTVVSYCVFMQRFDFRKFKVVLHQCHVTSPPVPVVLTHKLLIYTGLHNKLQSADPSVTCNTEVGSTDNVEMMHNTVKWTSADFTSM